MHHYVKSVCGPMREISYPEAKNDRDTLTFQRLQWDTLEQWTRIRASSIDAAPRKNGVFTPKITTCPYSSVRPHHVNTVNGANTPNRLPSLAGFLRDFFQYC